MTREEAIRLISEDRLTLEDMPEFADDKEVVMAAVLYDGYDLEYASEELRADKEIVTEAVKNFPEAIKYASERLYNDPDVIKAAGYETDEPIQGNDDSER